MIVVRRETLVDLVTPRGEEFLNAFHGLRWVFERNRGWAQVYKDSSV